MDQVSVETVSRVLTKDKVQSLVEVVFKFFCKRPHSKIRLADLQKLLELDHKTHPLVLSWEEGSDKSRGVFPDISVALSKDPRFTKTSIGAREVYYELSLAEQIKHFNTEDEV